MANEIVLTKEEMRALRNLVRVAFSDRLDNEQRKLLVQSLTEMEGAHEQPSFGPLADYRTVVQLLSQELRDTLITSLQKALAEYCARRR